ncbi:MAG: polysaccharide deacetylase family protein [Streptococcaceae bacterium]|jgi:peptidoglycan/xylan/chitin deacetylase (PgdA/CDA1 family)|nr:polysaccharide deacetylase family protein [Streptococcaceae bacterium]
MKEKKTTYFFVLLPFVLLFPLWKASVVSAIESEAPSAQKVEEVVLRFDANEGKVSKVAIKKTSGDVLGTLPKATRKNEIFHGWYTKKRGGKAVNAKTVIRQNTTLYAHWKVRKIDVDAKELLFGAKNKRLSLKLKITPSNADCSTLKMKVNRTKYATISTNHVVTSKNYGQTTLVYSYNGKQTRIPIQVAKKWVAFTFDDGPSVYTSGLVSFMKKNQLRATFYVVGTGLGGRGNLLKTLLKNGNEIGNHTWSHPVDSWNAVGQVQSVDWKLKKLTGTTTQTFRPPGGGLGGSVRQVRKPIILWSVDTNDWRDRVPSIVYNRVMRGARSGAIVLMHDIHGTTIPAAKQAFLSLKKQGFAFVTVSELLNGGRPGVVYTQGGAKVRTMKINY